MQRDGKEDPSTFVIREGGCGDDGCGDGDGCGDDGCGDVCDDGGCGDGNGCDEDGGSGDVWVTAMVDIAE